MRKLIRRFSDFPSFDLTTEVAVVGFGGAGGCAALEARRAGRQVLILERASGAGGSTALSACEMYLGGSGGTTLQRALGITDSSENFRSYLEACFGNNGDPDRSLCSSMVQPPISIGWKVSAFPTADHSSKGVMLSP